MILRRQHTVARRCAIVLVYAALAACNGGSTDSSGGGRPPTGVTTTSTPPTLVVYIGGGSATATLNFTRSNYNGPLTLTPPSGLPTGIAVTLTPTTLSPSATSATLTVTAGADASPGAIGSINIFINGVSGLDTVQTGFSLPLTVGRPQIAVTRTGTGTGTVTSSPAGLNCGSTCTGQFAYGTNVTLTATPGAGSSFGGWFSNTPCTGASTTCTLPVNAAYNITATFNSTAQTFALGVNPTTASLPQGGNATATATIARANGFAGAVTFSVAGAPSGLTVTPNPASGTDNSATVNITAASSVAVGNYPITITGTSSGVPSQTTRLNVQVTAAAGGSDNVALSYANCDPSEVPIWFAVQSGGGAWTRVTVAPNNTFTFAAGAAVGVAWVTPDGTGFSTSVFYGSRQDITSIALGSQCSGLHASRGTAQLTGSVTGIGTNGALVIVGGASTQFPVPQSPNFTLNEVPAGRRDLIGAAINITSTGTPVLRLILRRDVSYSGTIPTLNFGGPEFTIPVQKVVATNNLNGDFTTATTSFHTANGSTAPFVTLNGGLVAVGTTGFPDSLLQSGDLHAISIMAAPATGSSARAAILLHHSVVGDTVAFGPSLNTPTITTLGTSPVLRQRAQLASQSAYNAAADAQFSQNSNSVEVTMTAGYSGATPSTWSLDVPDLAAAGYDPTWGLKSGASVEWNVSAYGGNVAPLFGAPPTDGVRILAAGTANTVSSSTQRRRFGRFMK
jgi:hypothetical protein